MGIAGCYCNHIFPFTNITLVKLIRAGCNDRAIFF